MTLIASPTPSVLSIASSSSSSSCGDQSPRPFALDSFSDVSPSLTSAHYRNSHNVRSQSQPTSPTTVPNVISTITSTTRSSHTIEDANHLSGKQTKHKTSGRSASASFNNNNTSTNKKEKKKLTTRRLIDREKHSANECRRRTEMREKFFQLQEITHCVYKDRQNILITAIKRIAEQNARIARLEKEKLAAFREQGIVTPKPVLPVIPINSPSSNGIAAPAMVVSALPCKLEGGTAVVTPGSPEAQKVVSIPVNTLASIGATQLLPSFLLAHPDTIVDVNAAFVSLFHIASRESVQSNSFSHFCATSEDLLKVQSAIENIITHEPHHVAVGVELNLNGTNYNVELILRAILSATAPPQIYGVVSEHRNLSKDVKPITTLTESPVLPAVIIKEEPGLHVLESSAMEDKPSIQKEMTATIHSSSFSSSSDMKAPHIEGRGNSLPCMPSDSILHQSQMEMDISEPFYSHDEGYDTFFNRSPFPINFSHHMSSYDQFSSSSSLSMGSSRRPSISSAFVDTTIWNDIM